MFPFAPLLQSGLYTLLTLPTVGLLVHNSFSTVSLLPILKFSPIFRLFFFHFTPLLQFGFLCILFTGPFNRLINPQYYNLSNFRKFLFHFIHYCSQVCTHYLPNRLTLPQYNNFLLFFYFIPAVPKLCLISS